MRNRRERAAAARAACLGLLFVSLVTATPASARHQPTTTAPAVGQLDDPRCAALEGPSRDEAGRTTVRQGEAATAPRPGGKIDSPLDGILYDNGPLVNSPGTGVGGANESVLQNNSLGLETHGFDNGAGIHFRVADDFTVTDPSWEIAEITLWAYQTFAETTTSTITAVNYRIWDGPPNDPASHIVFGDTVTNRLLSSVWSGIARIMEGHSGENLDRPVMVNKVSCGAVLPAGDYWLDWQSRGSLRNGPWAPPVTITGVANTGDGLHFLNFPLFVWEPALDGDAQQAFPFILEDPGGAPLHDNGPLITHTGTGVGGADESQCQNITLGMFTWGFGHQGTPGSRVADDFTVTAPGGWDVGRITFYAYLGVASRITGVNYRIWDGPPDDPASQVVFGDTTTNRLLNSEWDGVFRVDEDSTGTADDKPVMANTVSAGVLLPPGDYWLDWQTTYFGLGPSAPPITITGSATTGNGLRHRDFTQDWLPATDSGTGTQQGFPFLLHDGNCDASTIPPIGPVKAAWSMGSRDDLRLSWPFELSSTSYNTWWVTEDPEGIATAREGGPWPSLCHQTTDTSCLHEGARTASPGDLFFYQVRGVCDTEEAPE